MYHRVIIIGQVTEPPEQLSSAKIRFYLASTTGGAAKYQVIWFTVFANGKLAIVHRNLKKGQRLLVEGTLSADETGHPAVRTNRAGKPFARYEIRAVNISSMTNTSSNGLLPDTALEDLEE